MPTKTLPAQTIRNIITLRVFSHLSYRDLAALLDVSKTTVATYLSTFKRSSLSLDEARGVSDEALLKLLSPASARQPNPRQEMLLSLLPAIHQKLCDPATSLLDEWKVYKRQHPEGPCYSRFAQLYADWLSNNGLTRWPRNHWTVPIAHDDYKVLKVWRSSNDKRKWQRAVALLDLHRHCTMASICCKSSSPSMSSVPARSSGAGALPSCQQMRLGRYSKGSAARAASSAPLLSNSRPTTSRTFIRSVRTRRR